MIFRTLCDILYYKRCDKIFPPEV